MIKENANSVMFAGQLHAFTVDTIPAEVAPIEFRAGSLQVMGYQQNTSRGRFENSVLKEIIEKGQIALPPGETIKLEKEYKLAVLAYVTPGAALPLVEALLEQGFPKQRFDRE